MIYAQSQKALCPFPFEIQRQKGYVLAGGHLRKNNTKNLTYAPKEQDFRASIDKKLNFE